MELDAKKWNGFGHLAGSVDTTCDSLSWSCEFKPHSGYRGNVNIFKKEKKERNVMQSVSHECTVNSSRQLQCSHTDGSPVSSCLGHCIDLLAGLPGPSLPLLSLSSGKRPARVFQNISRPCHFPVQNLMALLRFSGGGEDLKLLHWPRRSSDPALPLSHSVLTLHQPHQSSCHSLSTPRKLPLPTLHVPPWNRVSLGICTAPPSAQMMSHQRDTVTKMTPPLPFRRKCFSTYSLKMS